MAFWCFLIYLIVAAVCVHTDMIPQTCCDVPVCHIEMQAKLQEKGQTFADLKPEVQEKAGNVPSFWPESSANVTWDMGVDGEEGRVADLYVSICFYSSLLLMCLFSLPGWQKSWTSSFCRPLRVIVCRPQPAGGDSWCSKVAEMDRVVAEAQNGAWKVTDCSRVFVFGSSTIGFFWCAFWCGKKQRSKLSGARSKKSLDTFCKLRRSPKSLSQKRHWISEGTLAHRFWNEWRILGHQSMWTGWSPTRGNSWDQGGGGEEGISYQQPYNYSKALIYPRQPKEKGVLATILGCFWIASAICYEEQPEGDAAVAEQVAPESMPAESAPAGSATWISIRSQIQDNAVVKYVKRLSYCCCCCVFNSSSHWAPTWGRGWVTWCGWRRWGVISFACIASHPEGPELIRA